MNIYILIQWLWTSWHFLATITTEKYFLAVFTYSFNKHHHWTSSFDTLPHGFELMSRSLCLFNFMHQCPLRCKRFFHRLSIYFTNNLFEYVNKNVTDFCFEKSWWHKGIIFLILRLWLLALVLNTIYIRNPVLFGLVFIKTHRYAILILYQRLYDFVNIKHVS
jgi:hypothetical protein